MIDRTPTGPQQDTDRIVLSVAETAHRLGVTPDAVRAWLHRGTLPGEKVAGEWRVFLPRSVTVPLHPPTGTQQDETGTRQDADRTPTVEALASKDALIDTLRADVEYLRDQLDRRSRELAAERERFDVLHREALERIPRRPALTAGENAPTIPQTPQDAPGAAATTDTIGEPFVAGPPAWRRAPEAIPPPIRRRPWWRRLLGRPWVDHDR